MTRRHIALTFIEGGLYVRTFEEFKFIINIVAEAFLNKPRGNVVVAHKDGNTFNNRVENLMYIDKKKYSKISGAKAKSVAVAKIDIDTNEIIEEYINMREAGRKNFLANSTISSAIIKNRLCAGMKFAKI